MDVKELFVEMNTDFSGITSQLLEKITGTIEAVVIESDKQVNVSVSLATKGDIKIFDTCNNPIIGANYFVPVTFGISNNFERYNLSFLKWVVNDVLRIEAYGNQNVNVKVTVYYC